MFPLQTNGELIQKTSSAIKAQEFKNEAVIRGSFFVIDYRDRVVKQYAVIF